MVQIGFEMEAGGCPPLNINAMRAISVKSYLKGLNIEMHYLKLKTSYFKDMFTIIFGFMVHTGAEKTALVKMCLKQLFFIGIPHTIRNHEKFKNT